MPRPNKSSPRVFKFTLTDVANTIHIQPENLRNYLSRHRLISKFRRFTLWELIDFINKYPKRNSK